jgi:hypothetical protein
MFRHFFFPSNPFPVSDAIRATLADILKQPSLQTVETFPSRNETAELTSTDTTRTRNIIEAVSF